MEITRNITKTEQDLIIDGKVFAAVHIYMSIESVTLTNLKM